MRNSQGFVMNRNIANPCFFLFRKVTEILQKCYAYSRIKKIRKVHLNSTQIVKSRKTLEKS